MDAKVQEFIKNNSVEGEMFLPIKDFENRFFVSNQGRIISHDLRKNTIGFLRTHLSALGYFETQLRRKPVQRRVRVHTLVAEAFLTKPTIPGIRLTVNHKDGNKQNNNVDNLEWCSAKDNCAHAVETGLHNLKGSLHPHSKLTEQDVLKLRWLSKGGVNNRILGSVFGISREQARDIVSRKFWLHI